MHFIRTLPHQCLRSARPAFRHVQPLRSFTSAQPLKLKEDKERSGEEANRVKEEQLKKQEKGEGHWHEELASSSESHIAADREDVHDHDDHMEKLQEETAHTSQDSHGHGRDDTVDSNKSKA